MKFVAWHGLVFCCYKQGVYNTVVCTTYLSKSLYMISLLRRPNY